MKFLIKLKPMTPFFFGTDKTFSDETLHDVTSSYFPQQTHVLGMLRFFVLQSHSLVSLRRRGRWVKNRDFKKAFALIGGFDKKSNIQKIESFGKIESISPVFILSTKDSKIDDFHFIAPKDTGLDIEHNETEEIVQIANKKRNTTFYIKNFNPKIGTVNALTTSKFWKEYLDKKIPHIKDDVKIDKKYLHKLNLLSFDEVFSPVNQVGIRRDKESKSVKENDEGSFYHKTSYRFVKNDYEFAFVVEVSDDIFKEKEGFVYLGAERSSFQIKIEDLSKEIEQFFPKNILDEKLIALSDIEIENFDGIDFMINEEYIAHAFMKREAEKQQRASSNHSKSKQRCYIPRGSVLFVNEKFQKDQLHKKFGYNYFI